MAHETVFDGKTRSNRAAEFSQVCHTKQRESGTSISFDDTPVCHSSFWTSAAGFLVSAIRNDGNESDLKDPKLFRASKMGLDCRSTLFASRWTGGILSAIKENKSISVVNWHCLISRRCLFLKSHKNRTFSVLSSFMIVNFIALFSNSVKIRTSC